MPQLQSYNAASGRGRGGDGSEGERVRRAAARADGRAWRLRSRWAEGPGLLRAARFFEGVGQDGEAPLHGRTGSHSPAPLPRGTILKHLTRRFSQALGPATARL